MGAACASRMAEQERGSWTTWRASAKVPRNRRITPGVVGLTSGPVRNRTVAFLLADGLKLRPMAWSTSAHSAGWSPLQRLLQALLVVKPQEGGLAGRTQAAPRTGDAPGCLPA